MVSSRQTITWSSVYGLIAYTCIAEVQSRGVRNEAMQCIKN